MLGLLPFEALMVAEGPPAVYAADRWNFTDTQSATILGLTRMLPAPRAGRAFFSLGNPIYAKNDPRYVARQSGSAAPPARGGLTLPTLLRRLLHGFALLRCFTETRPHVCQRLPLSNPGSAARSDAYHLTRTGRFKSKTSRAVSPIMKAKDVNAQ